VAAVEEEAGVEAAAKETGISVESGSERPATI
jgi:hypothetical protein